MLASSSKSVQIWHIRDSANIDLIWDSFQLKEKCMNEGYMDAGACPCFEWSHLNQTKICAGSTNQIVTVYDIEAQSIVRQIQAHESGSVNAVHFWGPDHNTLISGGADGNLRIFDLRNPNFFMAMHESGPDKPILQTIPNPHNDHQMAVLSHRSGIVSVLDTRKPKFVQA